GHPRGNWVRFVSGPVVRRPEIGFVSPPTHRPHPRQDRPPGEESRTERSRTGLGFVRGNAPGPHRARLVSAGLPDPRRFRFIIFSILLNPPWGSFPPPPGPVARRAGDSRPFRHGSAGSRRPYGLPLVSFGHVLHLAQCPNGFVSRRAVGSFGQRR